MLHIGEPAPTACEVDGITLKTCDVEFVSCDTTRAPSRKDQKVIDSLSPVLRDVVYGNLVIDCEEGTRVEEDECDPEWIADDEDTTIHSGHGSVRFGNVEVPEDKRWSTGPSEISDRKSK
ncbi:hypothetical protein ANCDUO_04456 [Ancylostoma duodenale]|uniref:Uncharacterized protein n=1 Tax=Ancylostoma duodenale TaxID=51022 RepID=A0A0C2H6Z0_9BILA|nr:hypothetical protein ANCDUO_04456 [Ancylostoma duodenale]